MQADGGLVHHVEHASSSVPHRARELHALALARWKAWRPRGRATDSPVPAPAGAEPCLRTTRRWSPPWGASHREDSPGTPSTHDTASSSVISRRLRQVYAAHERASRAASERRVPPQSGTGPLGQVLRHAAQALLVLRLRKRVFHGAHGVVVGEVELGEVLALLRLVQDVPLLGWTVEDDVALRAA